MSFCRKNVDLTPITQRGFTYLALLLVVATMGAGMAAYGEFASHAAQREKEVELLFAGDQYRQAISSYYERSPGNPAYPASLEALLEDKRFPMPVRHLRKPYRDPLTGGTDWGVVEAPEGGIAGVHSKSEEPPIKSKNFAKPDRAFEKAKTYADWVFMHQPTAPVAPPPGSG